MTNYDVAYYLRTEGDRAAYLVLGWSIRQMTLSELCARKQMLLAQLTWSGYKVLKMKTRVIKSGDSWTILIPPELSFFDENQVVEIERVGDTLVLRAIEQETLEGIDKVFEMFSASFMEDGREFHPERERDWGKKWLIGQNAQRSKVIRKGSAELGYLEALDCR
jgi:antitoxin VapB